MLKRTNQRNHFYNCLYLVKWMPLTSCDLPDSEMHTASVRLFTEVFCFQSNKSLEEEGGLLVFTVFVAFFFFFLNTLSQLSQSVFFGFFICLQQWWICWWAQSKVQSLVHHQCVAVYSQIPDSRAAENTREWLLNPD